MRLIVLSIAASSTLLSSCAHSPAASQWPVAPSELAVPFDPFDKTSTPETRMQKVAEGISALVLKANASAQASSQKDWGSGDVVSGGGLLAVVGGLAEKIGLVNAGVGIGLLGGTGRARYQYPVQRQAYRKYESGLACVLTQVRLFNDESRVMVLRAGDPPEKGAAAKAPILAVDAVNKIRQRLLTELDAVSAEAPSRQELEALAAKYAQAASAPAATPAPVAAGAVGAARSLPMGAVRSGGLLAAPQMAPETEQWLVDEARSIGNSYAAEVARCTL